MAERLVIAGHREDGRARERFRLHALADDVVVDPPWVTHRKDGPDLREPRRLSDGDEARVRPFAPHHPRGASQRVVALVDLLASDEQDGRGLARDLGEIDEIRTDPGHVHVGDAALPIPGRFPVREGDDRIGPPVSREIARGIAGERLAGVHQRRLDERRSFGSRRALERAGPLPREGVHDVRAGDHATEILVANERRRKKPVDRRTEATEPHVEERRARVVGDTRSEPRGAHADQCDVMTERAQLAVQCARERLRSTDGRQRLLRDDDAHAESLGGAVDNRRGSLGVRPTSRVAFFG